MKTRFFFVALLLWAFGSVKAQDTITVVKRGTDPQKDKPEVSSVKVCGSGDVRIRQVTDGFSLTRGDNFTSNYEVTDGAVVLMGSSDYQVAIQQLESVYVTGSGDVFGQGTIKGKNLEIYDFSSGDVRMSVDYDTIRVKMSGSGDVALSGRCKVLYADIWGSGNLKIPQLVCGETNVTATGSGEVYDGKSRNVIAYSNNWKQRRYERGPLLDPHWGGFEAGLNLLVTPTLTDVYTSSGGTNGMELRPLRSWYFGFNIADVGVAFDKKHAVGMFTGIGLGWNNFSWNNNVTIEYDPDNVVYTVVPIDSSLVVKTSKYGALFLQAPLMVEVRPIRGLYIDLGVTAGLRIAQWNRVKYGDGDNDKHYFSGPLNQFKLDASLRVGDGDLGFFANYAILPIFSYGNNQTAHPISFGFSICF